MSKLPSHSLTLAALSDYQFNHQAACLPIHPDHLVLPLLTNKEGKGDHQGKMLVSTLKERESLILGKAGPLRLNLAKNRKRLDWECALPGYLLATQRM